jgi:hypothetical protein
MPSSIRSNSKERQKLKFQRSLRFRFQNEIKRGLGRSPELAKPGRLHANRPKDPPFAHSTETVDFCAKESRGFFRLRGQRAETTKN